jgi:hypothetical protein
VATIELNIAIPWEASRKKSAILGRNNRIVPANQNKNRCFDSTHNPLKARQIAGISANEIGGIFESLPGGGLPVVIEDCRRGSNSRRLRDEFRSDRSAIDLGKRAGLGGD